jgi:hypothetical protein
MTINRAVFTIDFEFFSHTPAYRTATGNLSESTIGLEALNFLLERLEQYDAQATFFIVAEIVVDYPTIIEKIADAGHEIASHTLTHPFLSTLCSKDRQVELDCSKSILEDVSGSPVRGFRSPAFDVPTDHVSQLDKAGYMYDSSVAPCRNLPGWYGGEYDIDRPTPAGRLQPTAADITELPIAVMPGVRLPLSGAWLRFFGRQYAVYGMKILARRDIPPVIYLHPWELVELPAIEGVPRRVYWRTGRWMRNTVEVLLREEFEYVTAATVIADQ